MLSRMMARCGDWWWRVRRRLTEFLCPPADDRTASTVTVYRSAIEGSDDDGSDSATSYPDIHLDDHFPMNDYTSNLHDAAPLKDHHTTDRASESDWESDWSSVFDRSSFSASSSTHWSSTSSATSASSTSRPLRRTYSPSSAETTDSDSTINDVRTLPPLAWFAQPHEDERRRRLQATRDAQHTESDYHARPRLSLRNRPFTHHQARHAPHWTTLVQTAHPISSPV